MDHAVAVGFIQRVRHLRAILQHLVRGKRPPPDTHAQSFAFQVLQHQVVGSFVLSNVIQNTDVRMRELGNGASLALETFAEFRIAGKMVRQDFDGDIAVQSRIAGAVNFAHPAGSSGRDDLVRAQACACSERHGNPNGGRLYLHFALEAER